jgi:hypothetical protein
MRPDRVVVNTPTFDQHLRFTQGVKDFPVQQFIPQLAVE